MNFIYIGKIKKLLANLTYIKINKYGTNVDGLANEVCIYDVEMGKYSVLRLMTSSVKSSFWRLFESNGDAYIFIPSYNYVISCLMLEDKKSLLECKKLIEFLASGYFKKINKYYDNGFYTMKRETSVKYFTEDLIEYAPLRLYQELFEFNKKKKRPFDDKTVIYVLSIIKDYDPVAAINFLTREGAKYPEAKVECRDMLGYEVIMNSGIDSSRILMRIERRVTPEYLQIALQNPSSIVIIERRGILEYLLEQNKDDNDVLFKLYEADKCKDNYYHVTKKNEMMIKSCIETYGYIENTPVRLVKSITSNEHIFNDVFEYLRPVVEYVSKEGPILSQTPMFEVLFPGIPNTIGEHLRYFSKSTTDCTKENFLDMLYIICKYAILSRLYELHTTGFITSEDIVKSELHLIYAVCDWVVKRVIRVKRSVRD